MLERNLWRLKDKLRGSARRTGWEERGGRKTRERRELEIQDRQGRVKHLNLLSHALREHGRWDHAVVSLFVVADLGAAAVNELPGIRRPTGEGHALVRA